MANVRAAISMFAMLAGNACDSDSDFGKEAAGVVAGSQWAPSEFEMPHPATPQGMIDAIASNRALLLESALLANSQVTDPAVRQYAKTVIASLPAARSALKMAVAGASRPLHVRNSMTKEQTAALERLLAAREPSDFECAILQTHIKTRERILAVLRIYSAVGEVSALREFAVAAIAEESHRLGEVHALMTHRC